MSGNNARAIICIMLLAVTAGAMWELNYCEFVNYDDQDYVINNVHIQDGLTLEGIRWALTSTHAANWHPLTWMSHMLDVQVFGMNAARHHSINLLIHAVNSVLLFLVFCRMTGAVWRSALVAALFALHPLHVESVAWVAERKDVLSSLFWILTMGAYVLYVERPAAKRYLAALLFFVLGLMSKPMLVTLPFVLLLMDFWPLERMGRKNAHTSGGTGYSWETIRPLIKEKIPFFALTVISSALTYAVQQKGGAMTFSESLSIASRIANAFISYVIYIRKTVLPVDLAVLYPHSLTYPFWQAAGAFALIVFITVLILGKAREFKYLVTGWLWYLGTLVPVIGFVQVGVQAMADRYTYIPITGLFIMFAWGISEMADKWQRRTLAAAFSITVLLIFLPLTIKQAGFWRNSLALFDRVVSVTENNYIAYNNRGLIYSQLGNHDRAIEDYGRSIAIKPEYADAFVNRGVSYGRTGRLQDALADHDRALSIRPTFAQAYNSRGVIYYQMGRAAEAVADYGKAIEINPRFAEAFSNRGIAYVCAGRPDLAVADYGEAIIINPRYAKAYYNRGAIQAQMGRMDAAIGDFGKALAINSRYAEAYNNRGVLYFQTGRSDQAILDYDKAIEINAKYAEAYSNRGAAYYEAGRFDKAIADFGKAIDLSPKYAEAYYNRGCAYKSIGDSGRAQNDFHSAAGLGHEQARKSLRKSGKK